MTPISGVPDIVTRCEPTELTLVIVGVTELVNCDTPNGAPSVIAVRVISPPPGPGDALTLLPGVFIFNMSASLTFVADKPPPTVVWEYVFVVRGAPPET